MSFSSQANQKVLLLFGAPGVGKGTYGKFIKRDFGFPTFSMGDYFRDALKKGDASDKFIQGLKATLTAGKLVDDDTVVEIVKRTLEDPEWKKTKGIMLDGVPRTVNQA